jgi:hypothetical protein
VRIAERRVGDQQALLGADPGGKFLGTQLLQALPRPRRRVGRVDHRHHRVGQQAARLRVLHIGTPVDDDVAEIPQCLGRPVARRVDLEQRRRVVEKPRGRFPRQEGRVTKQVEQECDVGLDAADAELAQRPLSPPHRLLERRPPRRQLDEQRIEVRRDDGAAVGVAVDTDREPAGIAVSGDPAVVRDEPVLRVFSGDPALQGEAARPDRLLAGHAHRLVVQRSAVSQQNLAADDIDPGDHFGDRVLDLDAGIHLDEVEAAGVDIDEKLHRAGRPVADLLADAHGGVADLLAQFLREPRTGRDLDHLLVPALHRTVALPEVDQIALHIAEDLHLDVLGAWNIALEEYIGLAESRRGLAPGFGHFVLEIFRPLDRTDAAPAPAEAGLDHQRVSDLFRCRCDVVGLAERLFGARDGRHTDGMGQAPCRRFVAKRLELIRGRPDEGDAGGVAGTRQTNILGEKTVAGMDGVRTGPFRHRDDLVDIEVGADRLAPLGGTDGVGLVRLEPVRGKAILVAVNRHRAQSELGGGAETADGNFRPVRNEELLHRVRGRR